MPPAVPPNDPPRTIAAALAASVRAAPGAAALLAADREQTTYGQLALQIDHAQQWLGSAGLGRRSRIALALPSGPELAVAQLALGSAMTCAPLNPALDEASLLRLLAAMRIDAVVTDADDDGAAARAARQLGVPRIVLTARRDGSAGAFDLDAREGFGGRRARAPDDPGSPGPDDIAFLMHTSGTTGTPKVVPLTQARLMASAAGRIALHALGPEDRCLLGMPLHTATGLRRGLLLPLVSGGSLVCPPEGFDAPLFIDLIERLRPTWYSAPAVVHRAILDELTRRVKPLRSSLRFAEASGAAMPPAVQQQLAERLKVPMVVGFGITEAGSIAQTPLPPAITPPGSVGRATHMEIRVREAGRTLGPGQPGEIQVRGPEVFDGYEGQPEATREVFEDGWYRTGDLGWLDADGFLFIAGRLKEMVSRGGNKIVPSEVEAVLATHPAVVEAVAFAVPHATLGEDLAAAVVLRFPAAEEALREFLRTRLAAFKVPSRVLVLTAIPKAAMGKPRRAELARIAAEQQQQAYAAPVTPTEQRLAAMFAELLQVGRVGTRDSFVQLGGDSLRGVRLLAKVHAEWGLQLRLDLLQRHPTVGELAATIDAARRDATPARTDAADRPPTDHGAGS